MDPQQELFSAVLMASFGGCLYSSGTVSVELTLKEYIPSLMSRKSAY